MMMIASFCFQIWLLFILPAAALSIQSVVVVGGTHGNEYTGVWCIRELEAATQHLTRYPSLSIKTLLANPQAHLENKRFVDSDLNREFSADKLLVGEEGLPLTVESLRAREINDLLGPKFAETTSTDLVVDLHSTTSNMGTTIIVPEGDALMTQAAAYVLHRCGPEARILMHALPDRHARPNLSSAARHGFTIEVGPVPQGVLRHDAVEKTKQAMHSLFEFLERRNKGEDVIGELQRIYSDGSVPCFRSAKAKRAGEMSGKIVWPCHPENPNFPLFMVHKSLQDRDFHVIRQGDPLFVTLDGKTIPYEGSHGDEVYLIFINEAGYYYSSSGTGIGVAIKTAYDLMDGTFVPCEEEEESEVCKFE